MMPEPKTIERESTEEIHLQEQSVLQVEDHSRSAQEILTEQQESRTMDKAPALFVP